MVNIKQAVFLIGNEEYGLDIMRVNTVEKDIKIEKISNPPKNVKGTIHLRGDVIPVYSLRSKFGLEDKKPDKDTRLIITDLNGMQVALEVDSMKGINDIGPLQINEVPPIIKSRSTSYVKSIASVNGRLILLLDSDGVLTEEEQNALTAKASK